MPSLSQQQLLKPLEMGRKHYIEAGRGRGGDYAISGRASAVGGRCGGGPGPAQAQSYRAAAP